jgi:hypothetical protein
MQNNVTLNDASRRLLSVLASAQSEHRRAASEPFLVAHYPSGRISIWRGDLCEPIDSSIDTLEELIVAGYAGWTEPDRSLRRLALHESPNDC